MTWKLNRRTALAGMAGVLATPLVARHAFGQSNIIRIGVLTDLSGPVSSINGAGSVVATQMAVADFAKEHADIAVEVISADMKNTDTALSIARSWFDNDSVDAIVNVPNSATALALTTVVQEKDKVGLLSAPGATDLTGVSCGPNHVQWTYSTSALTASLVQPVIAEGGDTWFFITPNYAFGQSLEDSATEIINANGGKVVGRVTVPFPGTTDFSTYLLQAQSSGARVICIGTSNDDLVNCVKQASEFGIAAGGQRLLLAASTIDTIHGLGLDIAGSLYVCESTYWDFNDGTRDFTKRFQSLRSTGSAVPTHAHAGDYGSTLHYLRSVAAIGVEAAKASGRAVVDQMKLVPSEDPFFGSTSIRSDGQGLHPIPLFQVKTVEESKYPYDYYKLIKMNSAEQAFGTEAQASCTIS